MTWIVSSNAEMKYDMEEHKHEDWLNSGPWYNKNIYSRINGSLFEDFITQARTDRYNIMWSLVAHEKENSTSSDDESSLGERNVPKKLPTDTLKSLSATLKYIDEWILMFPENYDAKCEAYKTAMGHLFKNISVTNNNLLTQKQRYTKTIEDISGQ